MKTITLQIDDSISDKFFWLLQHFKQNEVNILEDSDYRSDDAYLRSISGMVASIQSARAESLDNAVYLLENVDMLATNIERWYEQAHRSGVAEGISQGISQGKGQLLTYLLSMKFPNVNLDAYRTNIDNAAEDAILRYSARVLTANSIEEVFYDESHLG